jgi:hypothetical protein
VHKQRGLLRIDPKKVPAIVAIIFLIVGIAMLPTAVALKHQQARIIAESIAVPVEVIRVDSRRAKRRNNQTVSQRRQLMYRPVFQTTTPAGVQVVFESTSWSRPAAYQVGDKIMGQYHARSGAIHTDLTIKNQSLISGIVGFLGIVFIIVGAAILAVRRFRQ